MQRQELNNILIVEDDEDIRNLTKLTLTEIGDYKVECAANGRVALEMLKVWKPDLVLMDVKMPYLDGPSTLTEMKNSPGLKNIPVIFITGLSLTIELESLLKIGGLAYILKPYDPMELCDKIKKLWKTRNQQEALC